MQKFDVCYTGGKLKSQAKMAGQNRERFAISGMFESVWQLDIRDAERCSPTLPPSKKLSFRAKQGDFSLPFAKRMSPCEVEESLFG